MSIRDAMLTAVLCEGGEPLSLRSIIVEHVGVIRSNLLEGEIANHTGQRTIIV